MSRGLIWGTVFMVLSIFGLFSYGAYKADKVVAAKYASKRETMKKSGKQKN
ncbi:MAG: hypothetical protein ACM3X9_08930 [Bacillota bacterium]